MRTKQALAEKVILSELNKRPSEWCSAEPLLRLVMAEWSNACYYRAANKLESQHQIERQTGFVRITAHGVAYLAELVAAEQAAIDEPKFLKPNQQHPQIRQGYRHRKARQAAFARVGGWCVFCGGAPATDAHHWTYPPADQLTEAHLTPLCRACHDIANGLQKHRRKSSSSE